MTRKESAEDSWRKVKVCDRGVYKELFFLFLNELSAPSHVLRVQRASLLR